MYKLSCQQWNYKHVMFALFDPFGANCGIITVLTTDVISFIQDNWNGAVLWNGLHPMDKENFLKENNSETDINKPVV